MNGECDTFFRRDKTFIGSHCHILSYNHNEKSFLQHKQIPCVYEIFLLYDKYLFDSTCKCKSVALNPNSSGQICIPVKHNFS